LAGKEVTLAQLAYENEGTAEVTIVRLFLDADALDHQINVSDERSKKTYEFIEPISIEIYGTPNPATINKMKKIAGSGITVIISPYYLGGFIRELETEKEITMALHVEYSHVINRPLDQVFHFMVVEHVKNHPRWDSDIELWLDSDDPIGVGTIIKRRNSRSGTPVEGTMEVTEYEHNRKFTTIIHDGPAKMIGGLTFEPIRDDHTKVTTRIDLPDMDESMDTSFLLKRLAEVAKNREELIEAEVDPPPQ
jgi:hypothetical protein